MALFSPSRPPANHDLRWDGQITHSECLAGAALRVMSCAIGEDGREVVDTRCVSTLRGHHELQLDIESSSIVGEHRITLRTRRKVVTPEGWSRAYEEEYAVDVPATWGDLVIRLVSGSRELARLSLPRAKRKELLRAWEERTRHPFDDPRYSEWLAWHQAQMDSALELADVEQPPHFSIVCPVYCTPEHFLREMIDSVLAQAYPYWELVLVNASPDDECVSRVLATYDDPRICIFNHPENNGINGNTNTGIAITTGDYVAFVDHDDSLDPRALLTCAREILAHPETDVIYTDEDSFDETGEHRLPLLKPELDHALLLSNDYSLHFEVVSRQMLDLTERSEDKTNGAQDYDLMLKSIEHARRVVRIPKVLYHWRIHGGSTNAGNSSAKDYVESACIEVIGAHLRRLGIASKITREPVPFTFKTIISPRSPRSITVVSDPCDTRQANDLRSCLQNEGVDFVRCRQMLRRKSLAELRNSAARDARSRFVLFISAGDRPFTGDFLDILRSYFELTETGMVVPELLFPDGQRVDSGWVLCSDGSITHLNQGIAPWDGGYNGRACRPCQWTLANPAIQLVRRDEFLELGGYATTYHTLAYASADLCMRYRQAGKTLTYTPFAAAFHSEPSQTPYAPLPQTELDALEADRERLRSRWLTDDWIDPCFNPNLDPTNPYYKLKW